MNHYKGLNMFGRTLFYTDFVRTLSINQVQVGCRQIMMVADSYMSIFLHCFVSYCLKSCKNTQQFPGKKSNASTLPNSAIGEKTENSEKTTPESGQGNSTLISRKQNGAKAGFLEFFGEKKPFCKPIKKPYIFF